MICGLSPSGKDNVNLSLFRLSCVKKILTVLKMKEAIYMNNNNKKTEPILAFYLHC